MALWKKHASADKSLVFPSSTGRRMNNATANQAISRTLQRLENRGCPVDHFSCHAFRNTFATRFIEQGGNPQTLKTLLGHASLAMTMDLYSHVLPNTKQKEMDMLQIEI
jgi:integrase